MKTNINISANRIISIIEKIYTKEEKRNVSFCSRCELLAKIEKNNISMLDAMKSNDLEKAQQIAMENANILPIINAPDFAQTKANLRDTEKDFILSVERVFSLCQLPIEELQTLINIILKEAQQIAKLTDEKTE